jgi:plastocyanin
MKAGSVRAGRCDALRRIAFALTAAVLASISIAADTDFIVIQKNREFSVKELTVKVGDRVMFVNNDTVTHNVYSDTKGVEFEIELQPPGRTDSVRFSRPGVADVKCAIHPNMKLRVEVKP